MGIIPVIQSASVSSLKKLCHIDVDPSSILVNETKPEFDGDYTVVLFALVKTLKKSPEALGNELGQDLVASNPNLFTAFNVIKGFLNLTVSGQYWLQFLQQEYKNVSFGKKANTGKKVMVEY